MSSLSPKDRVSLCRFTFADGRCCRTPRSSSHPHFCYFHAQKEARAGAAETLGKDLAFFFSGDYLSANDLSTALARLIPAVVQGHVKPRAASTVAYLFQTLVQTIRISQDEYINTFGTTGWRKAIRTSVKAISTAASRPTLNPFSPNHPNLNPATNPSPTTRLTTRGNARKWSFRAQRGICFFRINDAPPTNHLCPTTTSRPPRCASHSTQPSATSCPTHPAIPAQRPP